MKYSRSTLAGVALLALGALLLIDELTGAAVFGTLFLLIIGSGLILAGVANRLPWLTVPGGILAGIGLGASVLQLTGASDIGRGGVFLICFALGWLAIVPASRAAGDAQTWAYIPAFIMALIGVALLGAASAPGIFDIVADWWPLALIIAGALALRPRKGG